VRTKTPRQADNILDAAARLFGMHRFHEVRMDDIAAEAEVGKGTLYRYFKDKEELYLALLRRAGEQYLEQVECVVSEVEGAQARLEVMVATIITYFDTHPNLLDLVQRAEVTQPNDQPFVWHKVREGVFELVKRLFEEGRRSGEFFIREPDLAAWMLLGGLRPVIRCGKQPRDPKLPARVVEGFLSGFARRG
jgi:TetR/AcrR family fatty acid metabolism transcriptional regulator